MLSYYCIASCDKCRTARKLLSEKKIAHEEIDMRNDGISKSVIENWIEKYGLDAILNTNSATWRTLDESLKAQIESTPFDIIKMNPAMLRRPILDFSDQILTQKNAILWLEAQ